MPRGSKAAYTDKQKRQAEHIEEGYKESGTSDAEAERRAWATVNKESGGGKKSGSGRKAAAKKSSKRAAKKSSSGSRKGAAKKSSKRAAKKTSSRGRKAAKKSYVRRRARLSIVVPVALHEPVEPLPVEEPDDAVQQRAEIVPVAMPVELARRGDRTHVAQAHEALAALAAEPLHRKHEAEVLAEPASLVVTADRGPVRAPAEHDAGVDRAQVIHRVDHQRGDPNPRRRAAHADPGRADRDVVAGQRTIDRIECVRMDHRIRVHERDPVGAGFARTAVASGGDRAPGHVDDPATGNAARFPPCRRSTRCPRR